MYKLKKQWYNSEYHMMRYKRVIVLDDNVTQADLEFLYKRGHPAVIMEKAKAKKDEHTD